MIPTRSSRPPVLASPGMTQMDLAKLIHRVVKMAVDGKRELGFAAVNVGCDGRERTTMFDGSSCQTEGEVCLAERQDGVTTCLSRPKQGNGLTFQSIAFTAPVCEPVTGWWIVDSAGYMYRVPQELIDAAPYWPLTPASVPTSVTLLRTGTWARLMCGAALTVPLNGDGGAVWDDSYEAFWLQLFAAAIGGEPDSWLDEFGDPVTGIGLLPVSGFVLNMASSRGLLLRDAMAPNAGSRVCTVTLPSAATGVVTGAVRIAYGYPYGSVIRASGSEGPSTTAPYPRSIVTGAWQADCAGRVLGDMALVYPRCLGVEYGPGHICLAGGDITDSSDYVSAAEIDENTGPARDVASGVIGLPNGEVALMDAADPRDGQRYRVRPAPDAPVAVEIIQRTKGAWGDDPNLWVKETVYGVDPWLTGATQFAVDTSIEDPGAPGSAVNVVLWETDGSDESYVTAPVAYLGTLGQTSGGLTTLALTTSVVASSYSQRYLTIVGIRPFASWGWTFEIDGIESALSILTDNGAYGYSLEPATVTFTPKITIPGGPTGTTKRHLYRMAWDYGSSQTGIINPTGPWAYGAMTGGAWGGLYDRSVRRVATFVASGLAPGTDALEYFDEDTDLTTAGQRPPSPLIYVGPITVEAPLPVHLLQPMNL